MPASCTPRPVAAVREVELGGVFSPEVAGRLRARLGMRQDAFFRADSPTSEDWLDTAIWAVVAGDPSP